MTRALLCLVLAAAVCAARADDLSPRHPQESHMELYRARLALYIAAGQTPEQVVNSMSNYFPWFGARFGLDVQKNGVSRYCVTIGHGTEITFFALLNP